jgi:hypothetical protein
MIRKGQLGCHEGLVVSDADRIYAWPSADRRRPRALVRLRALIATEPINALRAAETGR